MAEYYSFILAAGRGSRMGTDDPKQYLLLNNRPVVWHSINSLYAHNKIKKVIVLLSPDDKYFKCYDWSEFHDKLLIVHCGGETRAETVLNGLNFTKNLILDDDWVLVHDAVRPCLDYSSLNRLINEVDDIHGGILAVPVVDTLKKSNGDKTILSTTSRENLWRAQTPQMFKYKTLMDSHCNIDPVEITDESSAVEKLGLSPRLVLGHEFNIKITYPEDLNCAAINLQKLYG